MSAKKSLKIGIVGGGFSGTALLAMLSKLSSSPLEIIIFEKTGQFGAGPAYRTPFQHHLLNVRAHDMSAFEDEPLHFVQWLQTQPEKLAVLQDARPLAQQFVPRCFYYAYLQHLLNVYGANVTFKEQAVLDVRLQVNGAEIVTADGAVVLVDKVVLALGNNPPSALPLPSPIAAGMRCIHNPWDYEAIAGIAPDASVLIVGTGLSMIDAVLTLRAQQHQGEIYALSRHGLLPLPHSDVTHVEAMAPLVAKNMLAAGVSALLQQIRGRVDDHVILGGDWRSVINGLRAYVVSLWRQASAPEKRRFLRHLMPYWNIHRHRVPIEVADLLAEMQGSKQLTILAGRLLQATDEKVLWRERHSLVTQTLDVQWIINCMGPEQKTRVGQQALLTNLLQRKTVVVDELSLGLRVSSDLAVLDAEGNASEVCYALGAPTRGEFWEITAVPDIRKQVFALARHLLATAVA